MKIYFLNLVRLLVHRATNIRGNQRKTISNGILMLSRVKSAVQLWLT